MLAGVMIGLLSQNTDDNKSNSSRGLVKIPNNVMVL